MNEENIDQIPDLCLIEGNIGIEAEHSLEQLQAKLPNLKYAYLLTDSLSPEYITEFCGAFPLLIALYLPKEQQEEKLFSKDFVNAISSLQHLSNFAFGDFTDEQTHAILRKLPNLEQLHLYDYQRPSFQTLLSISQMSKLENLTIHIETVVENMALFTSAGAFSKLKSLHLHGNLASFDYFKAGHKFSNSRSELNIFFGC